MSKVVLLTLNWNNWEDSKNFLDSVFFLDYKNYDIIFIDNGSNDNSVDSLISFLTNKNLNYKIIDENNTIENIGENSRFYIIKNDENLGYTGGFNKGLEFILNNARDYEFIWILNNDTILNKSSLGNLVKCYYEAISKNIKVGAIGSKILYPNGELQMLGGCTLYQIRGTAGRINKVNDYYWVRNGFLFTKKHYPYFLPFVFFSYFFKYTIVRKLKNLPFNFDAYVRGVKDFFD
ncbi:glycosyl transferase, family 2 [Sulfurihydrogenibium azorense Az-Fu1]|uniref:Glycosyl transferase, family 2 n=1 Tax=Sulfurihydrogenibium azorense (strain DSM 15241 / OCM 825 / Az-Fu1) TaxID=204536 RepID=C1DV35_SULAA|nr:glycosyltransferase [Sulfurihydrogenibium azorense]ACN98613.1 glycosyl transferase, family 2 [Sulfurihydrogenibium azorense Az-Fu1]